MVPTPEGFSFRELNSVDLAAALQLIKRHNHDDFECASESYSKSLNGQFVLTKDNEVVGVTGARSIPGTRKSFWLSWTYLDPMAAMSLDQPTLLFDLVCEKLKEQANARKLFAMISPTVDSGLGGGHAYGGALDTYQDYGFQTELTHRDYYDEGESVAILSLRIAADAHPQNFADETRSIGIFDSDEIEETDDAYYFSWDFLDGPASDENAIEHWVNTVRQWEGRVVFVGLPDNSTTAIRELKEHGFVQDGVLTDFYEDGLHEIRLRYDL